MKTVSNSIKAALGNYTTQRKGRILVNGEYYDVYNVEYYADCYDEGTVIGSTIATELKFDIPYIEKFDTFKYYDGIWTGTSYEYVDMGTFEVFDENNENQFTKKITAYDNLIKFNKEFNSNISYPLTLYGLLSILCSQAGVQLANQSIPNGNFSVVDNQFEEGVNLKTILKDICTISGTFATIKNDRLNLLLRNQTNVVLTKDQHTPVTWKRRSYGINQVIIGDSQIEGEYVIRQDDEDIAINGVHKLVINDNPFAYNQNKRQQLIEDLYNQVHGFGYLPYEMKSEWLNYLELGDTINIEGNDTIVLRVHGYSPSALKSEMQAPAIIDNAIDYIDNTSDVENRLKLTERSVDKQNQIIRDTVYLVEGQNTKISEINQTVDEINSKISDIADITISGESSYATFDLNDINESEPIMIKIHPTNVNISYLYPRNNLYPSDTLYMPDRKIRFYNKTTQEIFDYILPDDLLFYDAQTFDEFYLDYDSQTCQVTKRCGYNADGSVYVLQDEVITDYPYPSIPLTDGDYTISLVGYNNGYLFTRLMAKNIYTSQFATYSYVNSNISQTAESITTRVALEYATKSDLSDAQTALESTIDQRANSITAEVNDFENDVNASLQLKVDKDDNDQVVSMINASADRITLNSNRLVVNSDNFKVSANGTITATNGTFSGTVTTGNLTATGGKIGGWTINAASITATNGDYLAYMGNISNTNKDFLLVRTGTSGNYQYPFVVRGDGFMQATKATITGTITATAGTIGGCSIVNGVLQVGNANITNINASKITAGTLNADRIGSSSISASKLNITSLSSISANMGTITAGSISSNRAKMDLANGVLQIFNNYGGSMILSNAARLSATAGVGISSNSTGNIAAPSTGIDIKGCAGATVYIGCMGNSAGTTERACVSVENGAVVMRSTGSIQLNPTNNLIVNGNYGKTVTIHYKNANGDNRTMTFHKGLLVDYTT